MQDTRRIISLRLYFIIISSVTNLTFIVVGIILLTLFSFQLTSPLIIFLIIFLLWKGVVVGLISWFTNKYSTNKEFLVKFIGRYLGSFFGMFLGSFAGANVINIFKLPLLLGVFTGGFAFYFAGRWVGPKVSGMIGNQLGKTFSIPEPPPVERIVNEKPAHQLLKVVLIVLGIILPLLIVISGLLFNIFDVPTGWYPEFLPIARIVVLIISISFVLLPWLIKKKPWLRKAKNTDNLPEITIYRLGMGLTMYPVIFGFLLFLLVGGSFIELCFYAVLSSITTIIWIISN